MSGCDEAEPHLGHVLGCYGSQPDAQPHDIMAKSQGFVRRMRKRSFRDMPS